MLPPSVVALVALARVLLPPLSDEPAQPVDAWMMQAPSRETDGPAFLTSAPAPSSAAVVEAAAWPTQQPNQETRGPRSGVVDPYVRRPVQIKMPLWDYRTLHGGVGSAAATAANTAAASATDTAGASIDGDSGLGTSGATQGAGDGTSGGSTGDGTFGGALDGGGLGSATDRIVDDCFKPSIDLHPLPLDNNTALGNTSLNLTWTSHIVPRVIITLVVEEEPPVSKVLRECGPNPLNLSVWLPPARGVHIAYIVLCSCDIEQQRPICSNQTFVLAPEPTIDILVATAGPTYPDGVIVPGMPIDITFQSAMLFCYTLEVAVQYDGGVLRTPLVPTMSLPASQEPYCLDTAGSS